MNRVAGTGARDYAWTPAQLAALVFGLWWTLNGVAVFIDGGDAGLRALGVHGQVDVLGISIAVNGWHGLFHLATGLVGLAVCAWPSASRAYALAAGSLYLVVFAWGTVAGSTALVVIYVDTVGGIVHLVEGLTMLAAWLVSR